MQKSTYYFSCLLDRIFKIVYYPSANFSKSFSFASKYNHLLKTLNLPTVLAFSPAGFVGYLEHWPISSNSVTQQWALHLCRLFFISTLFMMHTFFSLCTMLFVNLHQVRIKTVNLVKTEIILNEKNVWSGRMEIYLLRWQFFLVLSHLLLQLLMYLSKLILFV